MSHENVLYRFLSISIIITNCIDKPLAMIIQPPVDSICEDTFGNGELFPPSSYQCQTDEQCIYIDASSTCLNDCGSKNNAFTTIQSALDSLNGETVALIIKPGTYAGNIISPNLNNDNEQRVYLNIFSESGSIETIIDCQGHEFGFHFKSTTVKIHGFTIQNCIAPCRESFLLPNSAINSFNGHDTGRLGGAFFLEHTYITMSDIIILSNEAEFGGGIFAYESTIQMDKLIIEHNTATHSGGGIYLLNTGLSMYNTYIAANNAYVSGGGLYTNNKRTDIYCSIIEDNIAQCGNEVFCIGSRINVNIDSDGWIGDNNPITWNYNEEISCNSCTFYKLNNGIPDVDFCVASDESILTCDVIIEEDECISNVVRDINIPENDITNDCITDCYGMDDGDYTLCDNEESLGYCCNLYLTCKYGKKLNPFELCDNGQIWNSDLGICSDACGDNNACCSDEEPQTGRICQMVQIGECVSDCINVPNGDYQSCDCCDSYINCNNGELNMVACWKIDDGLVWDDNKKICDFSSETCKNKRLCEYDGNEGNEPEIVDKQQNISIRYVIEQRQSFENNDGQLNGNKNGNNNGSNNGGDFFEMSQIFMINLLIIFAFIAILCMVGIIYCVSKSNKKRESIDYETKGEEEYVD
eukprot:428759_1